MKKLLYEVFIHENVELYSDGNERIKRKPFVNLLDAENYLLNQGYSNIGNNIFVQALVNGKQNKATIIVTPIESK